MVEWMPYILHHLSTLMQKMLQNNHGRWNPMITSRKDIYIYVELVLFINQFVLDQLLIHMPDDLFTVMLMEQMLIGQAFSPVARPSSDMLGCWVDTIWYNNITFIILICVDFSCQFPSVWIVDHIIKNLKYLHIGSASTWIFCWKETYRRQYFWSWRCSGNCSTSRCCHWHC